MSTTIPTTLKRAATLLALAVICLQPAAATAIIATDLHAAVNDTVWYEECGGGSSATTSTSPSTTSTNLDLSYQDPARGNRNVPITVYLPSDGQPHTLLVFAPGRSRSSQPTDMYGRYLKAVADQGFVVAGMDFIDNATPHWAEDGKDVSFAVDKLLTESKLQGKINTSGGVGGFGHSDGGGIIMGVGYGDAQNSHIKAIISESGAANGGKSGPPLLAMYGDNDFNASGGQAAYDSVTPSYKALVKFKGGTHTNYLQGGQAGSDQLNPAADAFTGAFFKRFLEGAGGDTTDLKKMAAGTYKDITTFEEKGTNTPAGTGGGSPSTPAAQSSSSSCCPTAVTNDSGGGGKVWQLGDSLTAGMQNADSLEQHYKDAGFDPHIEGHGGRGITFPGLPLSSAPDKGHVVSGLEAVDVDKADITGAKAIVIELGTNDMAGSISAATFKSEYTQLLDKIKAINADAALFLVNISTYAASGHEQAYKAGNQVITELAAARHATVVDWNTLALAHAHEWLDADPMHLHPTTGGGYEAFSKLIVDTVKKGGATPAAATTPAATGSSAQCCGSSGSGSVSGDFTDTGKSETNQPKIWAYLTGRGLKPFQAAGIMGNMSAESGYLPKENQNGETQTDHPDPAPSQNGYGLVQTTPGYDLQTAADRNGKQVSDMRFQLDSLWAQLFEPGSKLVPPYMGGAPRDESAAGTALKASTTVEQATSIFELQFERHAPDASQAKTRLDAAQAVMTKFGSTTGANPGSASSGDACGGTASADGWTFPLRATQTIIKKGSIDKNGGTEVWCYTSQINCHHGNAEPLYPAADIMAVTGTPVLSPVAGTVINASHSPTDACVTDNRGDTISIHGDDNKDYFMGHFGTNTLKVKQGDKLTSGQEIAAVGTIANAQCTVPHLHIQQNPAGHAGGQTDSFNIQPILVKLFNMLPQ